MAESQYENSSELIRNNFIDNWDFFKINKWIESKSISLNCKRVKWDDNYENLQQFVEFAVG